MLVGTARRRGGARLVTFGFVAIGLSSFVLLGAGPRLLGQDAFSGLGLVWTVSTLFGIGLGAPTEQLMSRRRNAGSPDAVVGPTRWLVTMAVPAGLGCFYFGSVTSARDALPFLPWAMILAVLGWVVAVPVRGRLAGAGDLTAYTAVLAVEAVARILFVAAAWVFPGTADLLLPAGVGLPIALAAVVGLLLRVPRSTRRESVGQVMGGMWSREHLAFVMVSVGFQVTLNGAPLLLEWRSGATSPAAVGAFVAASTYFRVPAILVGGVATHALVELSNAWGDRAMDRFRASLATALRQSVLVTVVSVGVLMLAAPLALPVYYGSDLDLPTSVLVALPFSTVLASVAAVAVIPLLAAGRGGTAGLLWVAGAWTTCALLAVSTSVDGWTAAGIILGPALTLCLEVFAVRGLFRPRTVERGAA